MTIPIDTLVILGLTGFATSVLSGMIGMAGGVTLLAVMLLFLPPLVAIPLHGVIQLVSNGTRTVLQYRNIRWKMVWRYAVLLLPLGFFGVGFVQELPPDRLRMLIGGFIILFTWFPKKLLVRFAGGKSTLNRRFFMLGGVVGLLNVTVGATGPLIAPFFLNIGLTRQNIIGTKAACQMAGHLAKLIIFGAVGFAYREYGMLLLVLGVLSITGTWVGTQMLHRLSEQVFVRIYKTVLTLVAVKLMV